MTIRTAKQAIEAIDRDMREACRDYIRYLDEQSPIVSDSHLLLRHLYLKYDKNKVDAEIDRQFGR